MASLAFGLTHIGLLREASASASASASAGRTRSGRGRASLPAVRCGLRGAGTRKPLWRSAVISTEAIQAVQALKLAKKSSPASPPQSKPGRSGKLEEVFRCRIGRLIKADLVAVLAELRRQNEWELALQVFEFLRNEEWYRPDVSLYCDMIYMVGKNKLIEVAEELFSGMEMEGLQPNSRAYAEIIGAFLQVERVDKAMEIYKSMKDSGCRPDELTFTILIRNLEKSGKHDLASNLKKECEEFLESPEKFLEEVNKKYAHPKNPEANSNSPIVWCFSQNMEEVKKVLLL